MNFGSFNRNDDSQPMAEINVTPLVDVMLVLLIVFMITMPVLTHSIPLDLPTVDEQPKTDPKEPIRLAIDSSGGYVLGERHISLDELKGVLEQERQNNPDIILAIAADKNVNYDSVAQALDRAQQAGIFKIGFVTEVN